MISAMLNLHHLEEQEGSSRTLLAETEQRTDTVELVGVTHRKRCWSWGKIFRQYWAIL